VRHVGGVLWESGELLFFLLLSLSSFLLFFLLHEFLLSSLELGLSDLLLESISTLVDHDNNHQEVCEDKQEDRCHQYNTSSELDVQFWGGIREDEDSNDQSRVEGLVGQHVVVEQWGLVWLDSDQVQHIGVGRHQDEHILQEDEGVVNWHGKQHCGQQSSEEEVAWLDESPSGLLVNLEHDGVEGRLGLLDFHDLESLANDEHKEGWDHNGQSEDDV